MIGKVALTKDKGIAFVVTGFNIPLNAYEGFMILPSRYGENVVESSPRILGDLNDLIDFQRLSATTIKLIREESEAEEKKTKTKSLNDHLEDIEEDSIPADNLSTSL